MAVLTEQQRLAIETDCGKILVSAGAGSGKTHVLVERYIERLKREPALSVASLIAVTFTRKAANEMRLRLKARLRGLLENASTDERQRWATCLAEVDTAKIGTIHSLCETIIKAFPLDAGVDPKLEVLDELAQAQLIDESISICFRQVISEQSQEHDVLLEFDLVQVRQWLTTVLRSSLQFFEAVAQSSADSTETLMQYAKSVFARVQLRSLNGFVQSRQVGRALSALESCESTEMTGTLDGFRLGALRCCSQIAMAMDRLDLSGPETATNVENAWQAIMELADLKAGNSGGNKPSAKRARASIKALREIAADMVEKIPAGIGETDRDAFATAVQFVALASRAERIYAEEKRNRYSADYNDLILLAQSALEKENSAARRFYNGSIAEILVDEFQDTNRLQSRLITLLAGPQTKLFLIGDDKQSIYKFQGADVSTFNRWRADIQSDESGACLILSRSFRSHPQIVRFVNALFSEVIGTKDQIDSFDASFQSLEAARTDGDSPSPRVEVVCYSDAMFNSNASRQEQNRRAEAKVVADWIQAKVSANAVVEDRVHGERPINYGDFAVLVQRNRDFNFIEQALVSANIPYVLMGGRNFLNRQEIYDMENLLAFLGEPLNDHALLGILRSPMFAVSDDIIHMVGSSRGAATSLWQNIQAAARQRKPGFESLRRTVALLKNLIEDSGHLQLSELIRKAIERTGYDIVLLGSTNGHQRSRNLWKLVALALEKQELSCREFAENLRLMRQFNVQHTDASLDSEQAVKLMTIHSSKGLEFPAVILPVLDAGSGPRKERVLFHREFGVAINTARTDEDEKPAYFQVASAISDEMEIAEKKRLFYVAATRARDYLALFLNPESRNVPSFRTWLKDWLGLDGDEESSGDAGWAEICSMTFVDSCDTASGAQSTEQPGGHSSSEEENAMRLLLRANSSGEGEVAESMPPVGRTAVSGSAVVWDLVWPALGSEQAAPAPNAGVRITLAQSRQRLDPTIIGDLFHALMDNVHDGVPDDELLRSIAFAQGDRVADQQFFEQLVNEVKPLLETFQNSQLYSMLENSKQRLHEVPYFSLGEELKMKRPDLIFQDENGQWHLVDFKTDHLADSDLAFHVEKHRHQVEEYATELEKLSGIPLSPSLYFAHLGILCSL